MSCDKSYFGINIPDDDEKFNKLCEGRFERFDTEFTSESDTSKTIFIVS